MEPIVITGWGCCTPYGDDAAALLREVERGTAASTVATAVPLPADLPAPPGGETVLPMARLEGPDPATLGLRRPFPDRFTLMALAAADRAATAARLPNSGLPPERLGFLGNTCFGPNHTVERYLKTLLEEGPARVSAITFSRAVANAALGEICRRLGLQGASTMLYGATPVGYALDLLRRGAADVILCGGVDETRDLLGWAYLHAGLLREGLHLGEAAAVVVLERATSARRRGVAPLAEVIEYAEGFCTEATLRVTDFTAESIHDTMARCLASCGEAPDGIDLVLGLDNGHGALTRAERAAQERLFGGRARALSPRRTTGETFGSAEVLATILGAEALRSGMARRCLVTSGQIGGGIHATLLGGAPC